VQGHVDSDLVLATLTASATFAVFSACILHARGAGGAFVSKRNTSQNADGPAELRRDPDEWKTGDEPMTAAQRSYLSTLLTEAGEEPLEEELTKAEASKRIDELREKTGRDR
jgi:hypothetical protein